MKYSDAVPEQFRSQTHPYINGQTLQVLNRVGGFALTTRSSGICGGVYCTLIKKL